MTSISNNMTALLNRAPDNEIKPGYSEAASRAAQTQKFQQVAEKALIDIKSVRYEADAEAGSRRVAGKPQLSPPAAQNEGRQTSAGARFVGLMATIVGLLGEADSKGLENRLNGMRALAQLSSSYSQKLAADYEASLSELEKALDSASTTERQLEAAKARVQNAGQALERAQARLDSLSPDSPEYAEALAARNSASAELQGARQSLTVATATHSQAVDAARAANIKADEARQKANAAGIPSTPQAKESQSKNLSAAARMVEIMAKFAQLMGDAADSQLDADKAMATKIRDSQATKALAEAKKHEEEVAKAERLNKAMGCIGKVLGGLLTVISVVGAVFTGGASLALAAVGVALMAGDMIGKAVTGVSFMEQAMKPLMDHVLAPLIKELGKAASWALSKVPGISDDLANTVGNIAGAIAGALLMVAAMVVVAVVAKSAAGRIGPKMSEMIGKHVSKMIPDLLKQGTRSASRSMGQFAERVRGAVGLQSDAVSLAKYATHVDKALAVTEGAGASTQAALQIKSGVHQARAAQNLAAVVIATSLVESMSTYIAQAIEMFGDMLDNQSKVIEKIGREQQIHLENNLQIARNI